MFEFLTKVIEKDAVLKAVNEAIADLKRLNVLIGVPEENAPRDDKGINNAELLYIHTNGSVVNNIPARPVIEPALMDGKEIIGALLSKAVNAALSGNKEAVHKALERTGMAGQNMARGWFTNTKNAWDVNSENTVNMKGSARPLIDTGEMRKSITYVIREE